MLTANALQCDLQPEMSRILLTGPTGFIGPSVARALLAQGHAVYAAGRSEPDARISFANWSKVPHQTVATDWSAALRGMETVVHLAAIAHVPGHSVDAQAMIRAVNVHGTQALAQQAAAAGVRRFVFVSSIKVHGDQSGLRPHCAGDEPHPDDIYGASKAEAEALLRDTCASGHMELVIVRPPLVVGVGGKANVARLMRWVGSGMPLPFGSVRNRRSILGLDNLADLLVLAVEHPRAIEQPLLAADEIAASTPQLVRWMAQALRRPARLVRFPPRLLEIASAPFGLRETVQRLTRSQELDPSVTTSLIGWRPRLTTLESLVAMCASLNT
jgi:nucleoside-diphosphate-sugar epimerase